MFIVKFLKKPNNFLSSFHEIKDLLDPLDQVAPMALLDLVVKKATPVPLVLLDLLDPLGWMALLVAKVNPDLQGRKEKRVPKVTRGHQVKQG